MYQYPHVRAGVFLSTQLDPADSSRSRHFNISLSLVFRLAFSTVLLFKGSKAHRSRPVLAPSRSRLLSQVFPNDCIRSQ